MTKIMYARGLNVLIAGHAAHLGTSFSPLSGASMTLRTKFFRLGLLTLMGTQLTACTRPTAAEERAGATSSSIAPLRLIAIGGGLKDDNRAIFERLVNKETKGKVVIVPYASGDQAGAAKSTIEAMKKYAPDAQYLVLPDPQKDEESRKLATDWIRTADLVYFTGGDQSRITERLLTNGKPNALHQSLYDGMQQKGTPVGGTSAGAACLTEVMFTGGQSDPALGYVGGSVENNDVEVPGKQNAPGSDPAAAPSKAPGADTAAKGGEPVGKPVAVKTGPRMAPGLGLLRDVITDTHFSQRGRLGRLVAACEASGVRWGVGIAENRAVSCVQNVCTAVGDAAAMVVDVAELKREGLSRRGVRLSLLADGDRLDPRGPGIADERPLRSVSPRVEKAVGVPAHELDPKKNGAWDRDVITRMLEELAMDPGTPRVAMSAGFEVTISADARTRIHQSSTRPAGVTVFDARLDIVERKK